MKLAIAAIFGLPVAMAATNIIITTKVIDLVVAGSGKLRRRFA